MLPCCPPSPVVLPLPSPPSEARYCPFIHPGEPVPNREVGVDAFAALSSGILSSLISIPVSIGVARALGPSLKGAVALTTMILAYAMIIGGLGASSALIHFAGRYPAARYSLGRGALVLGVTTGLAAGLGGVAVLMLSFRSAIPSDLLPVAALVIAIAPVAQISQLIESVLQGLGAIVEVSVLDLAAAIAMAFVGVLVLVADIGASGWLIGLVVVTLLGLFARAHSARKLGVFSLTPSSPTISIRRVVRYGLRGYPGDVFHGVNYRLDLFVVALLLPISDVGLYAIATNVAELGLLVPHALSTVLMHRAASGPAVTSAAITAMLTRLTSLFLVVYGIAIWVGAKLIIGILLGPKYSGSTAALVLLAPGIWALGTYQNLINDLAGRGHFESKTVAAGIGATLTIALDIWLVPRYGIAGAAAASSLAYMATLVAVILLFRRQVPLPFRSILVPAVRDIRHLAGLLRGQLNAIRSSRLELRKDRRIK